MESCKFYHTPPALTPLLEVTPFEFCQDLRRQKTSLWAIMRHHLHDPTFSHFIRTPTCDKQTHRQTHDDGIYCASMALRAKKRYAAL